MVSFFWALQVALTFCISTALESIVNPSSSTISCGTDDNCTVTCSGTNACYQKKFYFYNNNIHFMCSGETACDKVKIFTSNVHSFTASMTGLRSFAFGRLHTSSLDLDTHVQCGPSSDRHECFGASFYYLNQGQSTHICEGDESCRRSMIHAVTPVALVCKGSLSCFTASFILPSDEQLNQQSYLTVSSGYARTDSTMKVYSLYPFTNVISADGVALDAILFVYGMRFNQYCIVSDTPCMDAVTTNIGNYDELTIINTYPDGIPSQSWTYNGDVLIFATFEDITFTPPSIPDADTLSILCLDCWEVTFQLGGVSNAVLSDASGLHFWHSTITGPSDSFELNIMHYSKFNKYYLQNTSTITAQSFGENAEVYLGKTLDVYVTCPLQSDGSLNRYWKCPNTKIWSTLQRNEIHLGTSRAGYWDLDTSYEFLIHFDFEEYPCTYIDYTSNCSFMTFNPTNHPSYQPSQQTTNPSSVPTHHPSSQPTAPPTRVPTHAPSSVPTHHPSSQPTKQPTRVPTHAPSSQPSKQSNPTNPPTMGPIRTKDPTSTPTINPTFDPTDHPTDISINPTVTPSIRPFIQSTIRRMEDTGTTPMQPSTDKDRNDDGNAVNPMDNLEMIPWVIAAVVGTCVLLAIFACCKRRMKGNKAGKYIIPITSNSDGGAQMARMPDSKSSHVSDEAVIHLNVQPKLAANVSKEPNKKLDRDITEVAEWLTSKVKLPQYVSNFVDNGYEKIPFVRDISAVEDLQEIGVTLRGHQIRILAQIAQLKAKQSEKKQLIVEKEENERQGHKPQKILLDELEGDTEALAPLTLEGSPPDLNRVDVMDIQGGVTLGSFPNDHALEK